MYKMRKTTRIEQNDMPHHESMKGGYIEWTKELIYTDLTLHEMVMYCYLKDKRRLSQKTAEDGDSRFYDIEYCDIFCVVSNQELMDLLRAGKTKIIEVKNNLEKRGLIKQIRQMDKSNKIFVYDYEYIAI